MSDTPTYSVFVQDECSAVAQAFHDANGRAPSPGDMGHNSYRRIPYGWTHPQVIGEIQAPGLTGAHDTDSWFGWRPVDYATYVNTEAFEVAQAYTAHVSPANPTPGDMGHTAWRRFAEFWTHRDIIHDIKGEPLEDGGPGGAQPVYPVRQGLTRASGRRFVDGTGVFCPLGGTLMWAMRGWKYERDRLKQNIDYLAKYHYDYLRLLTQVGWEGNTIDEDWPDHVQVLGEVIDYAYSKGVRTQVTGIGGGSYNADTIIAHMISAIRPRASKVIYNEVVNEWYGNYREGETRMKAQGKRLKASLPNLVALSAPREELATKRSADWVKGGYANLGTMHLDRTDSKSDWKWRHVRKPWESRNPSFPESHGEPGGPLSSVASFMEPIHLVMSRAVGILCGVEAYCLHNGAGVGGQIDGKHHRPANLWETPGIDRCMTVVRALDTVLPPNPSNGVATRTGLSGHPLTADKFWPDSGADHGVVRDYARRNGRTFWQCVQGIKQYVHMKADKAYNLTLIDPVTLGKQTRTVQAGQSFRLDRGSTDTRGYGAWIILGTQR